MDDEMTMQAIVTVQPALSQESTVERLALFYADGTPVDFSSDTVRGPTGATGPSNVGAPVVTATAIGTAAKTVTNAAPATNTFVAVKFTNGNSANSPTIAFAGGSAIPILLGGTASTGAKLTVAANGVVVFFFDGTNLHQLGTVA